MNGTPCISLGRYGIAVLCVALATVLRWWLDPIVADHIPFTAYYAAIMVTAWYGGAGPSIVAIVSGALVASYLFIEPRGSFLIHDLEHQVGLVLYVLVGVTVTMLTESLRRGRDRTEAARAELAAANRDLQKEIAERKQAERWLLESEERFRSYFEQGLVGMAILSCGKDWVEVNERLCKILGFKDRWIPPLSWGELTHEADREAEERQFQHIEQGIVSGFTLDKRFRRKDGVIVTASVWVQAMKNSEGVLKGFLVLVQDISDRRKAEEEALGSQRGILDTERLAKQRMSEELAKAKD